jgi:hypothetical protein
MLLYLDLAYDQAKHEQRLNNLAELRDAILEGAARRLRPVDDGIRRVSRIAADHVVYRNRCRSHEADCSADDRRDFYFLRAGIVTPPIYHLNNNHPASSNSVRPKGGELFDLAPHRSYTLLDCTASSR